MIQPPWYVNINFNIEIENVKNVNVNFVFSIDNNIKIKFDVNLYIKWGGDLPLFLFFCIKKCVKNVLIRDKF